MKLRAAVLALAALGIPLALLVMILPIAWGYGGYISSHSGTIVYVDPAGPAARAGLHQGDRGQRPRGVEAIEEDSGNVGTVAHLRVIEKDGTIRSVNVPFVAFSGQLALQQQLDKLLAGSTALGAFLVAILVLLRARDPAAGTRAAAVLVIAGAGAFCQGFALVCGNAWVATLYWITPLLFSGATIWAALLFLKIYPPAPSRVRTILAALSPVPLIWSLLTTTGWIVDTWNGTDVFKIDAIVGDSLSLIFLTMLGVAIVNGMLTAGQMQLIPMRWLGSMWLAAVALGAIVPISRLGNLPVLGYSHYADFVRAAQIFCLAFGVAYPVLRHRLVDLNILVSRATVFGVVSAIIVGIFIAAEWAIGKIFERSMGLSSENGGFGAQIATLVVVLALGISARSIHAFVEDRMTKTFFRKRMRGLAEIQRVAHEADAATDPHAIITLAVTTVQHCLEPLGAALYLHDGEAYRCEAAAGTLAFPAVYGFNEGPPLRLRRWQEPFEIDDDSDERHHMLFVPMTLRSTLVGFLCCGPKPDRTAYLDDEIAALSLLAQHVGIATALLGREPAASSLTLVGT